jgi:hypothetical protein
MRHTWSTISAVLRFRVKPMEPVAQKLHAIGHPTWVDTQSVVRSSSGISTDSMRAPSRARSSPLTVPSAARRIPSSSRARVSHSASRRARSASGRSVIRDGASTPRV